jgi:F0F1-type ATP synthase epsilon subunit
MKFRIILPEGKSYHMITNSVIIPLSDGLAGIMKGHSPMLAELADGVITLKDSENNDAEVRYRIQNGLIEVLDDNITVLADNVEVLS